MKGIQFIRNDLNIDFVGNRFWTFFISVVVVILAVGGVAFKGLKYGIDFEGGILMEVRTAEKADIHSLRNTITDLNLGEVSLQSFGNPHDVMIRIQKQKGGEQAQEEALQKIKTALGKEVEYRGIQRVGPKAGNELIHKGIMAVIWALVAMMIYIWVRFDLKFGISAMISLLHDCFAIMALYSLGQLDFGTNAIVAILTTAGYSINDTVVVFDRIRENIQKSKKIDLKIIINRSINETLSRTILTAGSTLLSLLALYLFGGEVIASYSLPIMWGIGVGTFSSICLAAPLLLYFTPTSPSTPKETDSPFKALT
jgi:preprotein translocase SecF subunit